MRLPVTLQVLRHRNFRLYVAGQGTAHTGNWLQLVTTSWLVYQLSDSTTMLGLAAFALQIPYLFIAPVAGVLVDRLDNRRVLYVTNSVALTISIISLTLVASGVVTVWHLVLCNLAMGFNNALDAPARQSMLARLVNGRGELPHAIALNSGVMNGARFVGPMLGGAVIASLGATWTFALNSLLRLVVIAALLALRLAYEPPKHTDSRWITQFRAGLSHAYGFLPIRYALMLLMATSFTVQSFSTLLPWFASERYHGDAHTLGQMFAAAGCGAFVAMIYLALRGSIHGLFRLIGWSATLAGAALLLFSMVQTLWLGLLLLLLSGMGMMLTAAGTNTLLQSLVDDGMRGRIASLYVFSFFGIPPLGSLLSGWLASHIGGVDTLIIYGAAAVVASLLYASKLPAIRREVKPVYARLGIASVSRRGES